MDLSRYARARVGVLGGSFDPVHNAHIALASFMATHLALDVVLFVPAGNPWQKDPLLASPEQRVAMLERALSGFEMPVAIDTRELARKGPSYTIDTLVELRSELGNEATIVLLMGADQFRRLNTWKDWLALLDHASIAVCGRTGYRFGASDLPADIARELAAREVRAGAVPGAFDATRGQIVLLEADLGDISSSQIREAIARGGLQANRLVPAPVLDYIRNNALYRG